MTKVALLISRYNCIGGLEKSTKALWHAFEKRGCKVTILTTGEKSCEPNVTVLGKSSSWSYYHLNHFDQLCKDWLQKNPQDIVFGMERTTTQTHLRAGSGVHKVYLHRRAQQDSFFKKLSFSINPLHLSLLSKEKKAFEDPSLKVLFTNSQMVAHEILENYQVDPSKIAVVHNGVQWHEWQTQFDHSQQVRKEGPFHLLFIGNGYQRKGLAFLLQALSLRKQKNFVLSIVGKEKNISFYKKMTAKLGLSDVVTFFGPQKNLFPFYTKADALVIPSLYDPFANVTVEASAMGLFVVSSAYNGGHEVLTPNNGVVIENLFNPESVAHALEFAFARPKTKESAQSIRNSVKGLDFSNQLDKIVNISLQHALY